MSEEVVSVSGDINVSYDPSNFYLIFASCKLLNFEMR